MAAVSGLSRLDDNRLHDWWPYTTHGSCEPLNLNLKLDDEFEFLQIQWSCLRIQLSATTVGTVCGSGVGTVASDETTIYTLCLYLFIIYISVIPHSVVYTVFPVAYHTITVYDRVMLKSSPYWLRHSVCV